jgi:ferrochelatase
MKQKTAIILFNLGGPDELKAVRPFLFNMFSDPAIIRLPQPFRWLLAQLISRTRGRKSRGIYQKIGGKSPLLDNAVAQGVALEKQLKLHGEYKTFVCMRYWHPMSRIVVKNVKAYNPDRILLLPLYPQFSTTTTASSIRDWEKQAKEIGLNVPTASICCYGADRGFVIAHVKMIKDAYWKAADAGKPRVLFSAHGLPEKIIKAGDPYQWQVEQTAALVAQILAIDELDSVVCYQSKVGPMKWLKPSIEDEIKRAGADKVPLVVVPIAFVSEHSETLVDLDIECRKLADNKGVPAYVRVPALGVEPLFIEMLADLCLKADTEEKICSFSKSRNCPEEFTGCPCAAAA